MSEVAVLGLGAFVPGHAGLAGWLAREHDADALKPSGSLVPARQRRRASGLSRAMADAYRDAVEAAAVDPAEVASVFGSALGEADTMIELLDQMWSEQPVLSPMKFATSVHNAASGTISIATGNMGYTTSIGADYDTPAMALVEAIGWAVARGEPVVVCCADEAPPEDLVPEGRGWSLMAAALALGPVGPETADATPRLGLPAPGEVTIAAPELPAPLARNPVVGLLDLVSAIAEARSGRVALDRGDGRGYVAGIRCAAPA